MVSIWRTTKSRPTVEWKSGPKIAKLTRNFVIIWIPRVRNFYHFPFLIFFRLALEDLENPPENLNFDLKDFFRKTRPTYQFVNCRLEFIDCRRMWEIVQEANIKNHDCINHFMKSHFYEPNIARETLVIVLLRAQWDTAWNWTQSKWKQENSQIWT